MSGLIEAASAIMSAAERRISIAAGNVSNISTPGYKRRTAFLDLTSSATRAGEVTATLVSRPVLDQGKLIPTGNRFDVALGDSALFVVRAGDRLLYTRYGQFHRDASGSVVTPQGYALQQVGGGDLVLDNDNVSIGADGTVFDGERPVARVAIVEPGEGASAMEPVGDSYFAAPQAAMRDVAQPALHSGMIEASNVSMSDEMVASMSAIRDAERGARLAQTYDDLMGRVMTALGQVR